MKRRIDLLLTVIGAILLFAGIVCYFYYYTMPASEYFNWTTVVYPWREYGVIIIFVAIVLLVAGFVASRKTDSGKLKETANTKEPQS